MRKFRLFYYNKIDFERCKSVASMLFKTRFPSSGVALNELTQLNACLEADFFVLDLGSLALSGTPFVSARLDIRNKSMPRLYTYCLVLASVSTLKNNNKTTTRRRNMSIKWVPYSKHYSVDKSYKVLILTTCDKN